MRVLRVLGLNHRTAPIQIRERFHLAERPLGALVHQLTRAAPIDECVVLTTCNRTEYYFASTRPDEAETEVLRRMAGEARLTSEETRSYLYRHSGFDAVVHLYRVTAGLDSLVIGEPQIQGQVGDAYEEGRGRVPGSIGPVLHRLFQSALATGGRVRADTAISRGSVSVPSAALALARKVYGDLAERSALVLGTGEMGELTARVLVGDGASPVWVASRDPDRATELAERVGVRPLGMDDVDRRLAEVDVLVASTAAMVPVVTAEKLRRLRAGSGQLVVLDIALPRNVEPEAAALDGVFLYNVDDLQRVVGTAQQARAEEVSQAEEIVHGHADRYWRWYGDRGAAPLIRELREAAEEVRRTALVEALAARAELTAEQRRDIDMASRTTLNKILHIPTRALSLIAQAPEGDDTMAAIRRVLARRDADRPGGRRVSEGDAKVGDGR